MAASANYLAIDLGASSGRAVLGTFDGERLRLEELHRFANGPVAVGGRLYWNALSLLEEIKVGIRTCTARGVRLESIGIDTWGVDFGLLARGGGLLETPRHYRDPRNHGVMERVFERVSRDWIYDRTGIQFLPFNTLFQLAAVAADPSRLLDQTDHLLFMPDLFTHWLTGDLRTERSIASTSQLIQAQTGRWDEMLLERVGLPAGILPPIVESASPGSALLPAVAEEVGQPGVSVVRTATHDTAAAVTAVPAEDACWAYVSSGTWSLVGVELPTSLINPAAREGHFTNEAGVEGTTRFLRNVAGLWLVEECRRVWMSEGDSYSHAELARLAADAPLLRCFVDPDDARFSEPGDMPVRIRAACRERGQVEPGSPGEIVRCVLESLALKVRHAIGVLESVLGYDVHVLHVVGGGAANALLNQFTADATGKLVVAGPIEATATGNILVQAMAQGRVGSLRELRQIVMSSTSLKRYEPLNTDAWDEAAERLEP